MIFLKWISKGISLVCAYSSKLWKVRKLLSAKTSGINFSKRLNFPSLPSSKLCPLSLHERKKWWKSATYTYHQIIVPWSAKLQPYHPFSKNRRRLPMKLKNPHRRTEMLRRRMMTMTMKEMRSKRRSKFKGIVVQVCLVRTILRQLRAMLMMRM